MLDKHFDPTARPRSPSTTAWEASGAFAVADRPGRRRPIPSWCRRPTSPARLHVGHALNFTLQDILVRFRRMQGDSVLWQPGTDHAGIATQMVVERALASQGLTRQGDGARCLSAAHVWEWKAQSGGATLRVSCAASAPRWTGRASAFTMDDGLSARRAPLLCRPAPPRPDLPRPPAGQLGPQIQPPRSPTSRWKAARSRGSLWHLRYPIEGRARRGYRRRHHAAGNACSADTAVAVHPARMRAIRR